MAKRAIQDYLERAEAAKIYEQNGEYKDAARCWRDAWKVAPSKTQVNWSLARAEACFKRAWESGEIKKQRSRQYDFNEFMGVNNE